MRCLLVDDEPGIREGLAALLRLRGHEVHAAADCAAAHALLAAREFDFVVTDWRLPDGNGAELYAAGVAPIAVISGHPEEVVSSPRLCAVLQKPIDPKRLFALLQEHAAPAAPAVPAPRTLLPIDVRRVLERALQLLGGGGAEVVDDGVFVTLRAPWPGDHLLEPCLLLGGDLRVLAPGGRAVAELRWCRDGRPAADMATVHATAVWPDAREFAVDLHDSAVDIDRLRALAVQARVLAAAGVQVWLLNVPEDLQQVWQAAGESALPTPVRIGPSVPVLLAELWR